MRQQRSRRARARLVGVLTLVGCAVGVLAPAAMAQTPAIESIHPQAGPASTVVKTSPAPSFATDLRGSYLVQLVVSDGIAASEPDTVSITAASADTVTFATGSSVVPCNWKSTSCSPRPATCW